VLDDWLGACAAGLANPSDPAALGPTAVDFAVEFEWLGRVNCRSPPIPGERQVALIHRAVGDVSALAWAPGGIALVSQICAVFVLA
jgi:hypothetical protein